MKRPGDPLLRLGSYKGATPQFTRTLIIFCNHTTFKLVSRLPEPDLRAEATKSSDRFHPLLPSTHKPLQVMKAAVRRCMRGLQRAPAI
jgi:hypothetical protein